jgi:streptogramin lyase
MLLRRLVAALTLYRNITSLYSLAMLLRRLVVVLALLSCAPSPIERPAPESAESAAGEGWTVAPDWPRLDRPLGRVLGVAVDGEGRVWFSHTGAGADAHPEILALDPDSGAIVAEIDARRFASPHALAFDASGRLWVTDDAQDRVVVLDPSGREELVLGGTE